MPILPLNLWWTVDGNGQAHRTPQEPRDCPLRFFPLGQRCPERGEDLGGH